ncbi:hypothetical protein BKA66DRAFT_445121 [Pyrenochaeta sp. MPI-SDFR-AT-0127]|nr:hypothetical protein BKA66DRAFT_445121 [Pyrenochaeta sp. MPI-SDFR-AT-0127]
MSQLHSVSQNRKYEDSAETFELQKRNPTVLSSTITSGIHFGRPHINAHVHPTHRMAQRIDSQIFARTEDFAVSSDFPSLITGFGEVMTATERYNDLPWEHQPASNWLAPSRPLSLLLQPANINLKTHARKAQSVYLSHFDVDDEPQGRITQRLRTEEKKRKRRERYLRGQVNEERARALKRDLRRRELEYTGHIVEVIDLTEDDVEELETVQEIMNQTDDRENHSPVQRTETWELSTKTLYPTDPVKYKCIM